MLYLSRIRILLINSRYTYMDNRISALLKKYHSNEISLEELRVLTGMINNISNEELYMVLNKHWEEYDDYLPLSHEKMNALYKNVQSKKKNSSYYKYEALLVAYCSFVAPFIGK